MRLARLSSVLLLALSYEAAADPSPCGNSEAHVYVRTRAHRLWLCEAGRSAESYRVRLGKGGVGKTREGDGKSPLGTYTLGEPRPSNRYGTFIPIGYPTKEQQAKGYTGSAVGVHGPHWALKWLGQFVNTFDSSDGCFGLAKDAEMAEISAWITRTRAAKIILE